MASDPLVRTGDAVGQATARKDTYCAVLAVSLAFYLALGVFALAAPMALSDILRRPTADDVGWIRLFGALCLMQIIFYLPGYQNPLRSRYPNVAGVLVRSVMGLVWIVLGGGFIVVGVVELVFALVLGTLFLGWVKAEIMSRP